jgi:hypothetical protein
VTTALALLLTSCDGDAGEDAGRADGGDPQRSLDAGPTDSRSVDRRLHDGGSPAAAGDAGPLADASDAPCCDAASPDAGSPDAGSPDAGSGDAGAPLRTGASVFFLGHSLINFHMPEMLADLAGDAGWTHEHGASIGIGASLRWQWEHPETTQGDDPIAELASGRFDVFVMAEASDIEAHIVYSDTIGFATRYTELALAGDPGTQTYFYETWPSRDTTSDWHASIEARRPLFEQVADAVSAATPGKEVRILPAARALSRLVERVESGGVAELTSTSHLFTDDIHLGDVGNYFIALVAYATIYQRSPAGLTAATTDEWGASFAAPSEDAARAMQELAWEVVSSDPRAGVPCSAGGSAC